MNVRPARPGPRSGRGPGNRPARAVPEETFTVIHGGAEIEKSRAGELLAAVSDWAAAADLGVTRVAEVWGLPWKRLLGGCLATAAAAGGPLLALSVPAAEDLVASLRARGVAVRYRQAWQPAVDDAELRAVSQGWPVRYI
jgi:hypothetical protein